VFFVDFCGFFVDFCGFFVDFRGFFVEFFLTKQVKQVLRRESVKK